MRSVRLLSRSISVIFRRHLPLIPALSRTLYTFQPISQSLSVSSLPPGFLHFCFSNQFSKFFSSISEVRKCWNCDYSPNTSSTIFLVCDSCHCIQPLDPSIDYFRIFGLEQKYDIEESSLEGMYKNWQKKLHPDLVHSKSESEKEYAAEQSARVIDAYRTLRNPLSRAIYLMKLQGVHVDEEQTVSDPELLAEVMEIRESVEEASDTKSLKHIQAEVQEKLEEWSERFAEAFKSEDTEEALNAIRRMTYYKRANEEILKRL